MLNLDMVGRLDKNRLARVAPPARPPQRGGPVPDGAVAGREGAERPRLLLREVDPRPLLLHRPARRLPPPLGRLEHARVRGRGARRPARGGRGPRPRDAGRTSRLHEVRRRGLRGRPVHGDRRRAVAGGRRRLPRGREEPGEEGALPRGRRRRLVERCDAPPGPRIDVRGRAAPAARPPAGRPRRRHRAGAITPGSGPTGPGGV
jgi:hypothetical protein